jgi:hypothetical protein
MTMQRRSFFKLIAGAMLAPVAAKASALVGAPLLIGDGVHNDGPAINALLRGEVVEFGPLINAKGVGWVSARKLVMPKGKFMSHETIVVTGVEDTELNFDGADFQWVDVDFGMNIFGARYTTVHGGSFNGSGVKRGLIHFM